MKRSCDVCARGRQFWSSSVVEAPTLYYLSYIVTSAVFTTDGAFGNDRQNGTRLFAIVVHFRGEYRNELRPPQVPRPSATEFGSDVFTR
jgi:hypothetical protein